MQRIAFDLSKMADFDLAETVFQPQNSGDPKPSSDKSMRPRPASSGSSSVDANKQAQSASSGDNSAGKSDKSSNLSSTAPSEKANKQGNDDGKKGKKAPSHSSYKGKNTEKSKGCSSNSNNSEKSRPKSSSFSGSVKGKSSSSSSGISTGRSKSNSNDMKGELERMMNQRLESFQSEMNINIQQAISASLAPLLQRVTPDQNQGGHVDTRPETSFESCAEEQDVISVREDYAIDSICGTPSPKRPWRGDRREVVVTSDDRSPSFVLPPGLSRLSGLQISQESPDSPSAEKGGLNRDPTPAWTSPSSHGSGDAFSVTGSQEAGPLPGNVVPHSWPGTVELISRTLHIPVEIPDNKQKTSVLESAFSTASSHSNPVVPALPVEGIIDNRWEKVNKGLPKVPFSEVGRLRQQYRWPEEDFEKRGRVPDVDKSVSTYMATKLSGFSKFKPRTLFPAEHKAEKALASVDQILRSQQRVVSHASYFLVGLRQAMAAENKESSEEDIASLLGALATSLTDLSALSISASAKCVQERRAIFLDALNLPDKSDQNSLMKVPIQGTELFGGKFNEITKESSQLRRDAKEMAQTMVSTSSGGQFSTGPTKRKAKDPPAQQFKRFKNLAPQEEKPLPPPAERRWPPAAPNYNRTQSRFDSNQNNLGQNRATSAVSQTFQSKGDSKWKGPRNFRGFQRK